MSYYNVCKISFIQCLKRDLQKTTSETIRNQWVIRVLQFCWCHFIVRKMYKRLDQISKLTVMFCQISSQVYIKPYTRTVKFIFNKLQQHCKNCKNPVKEEILFLAVGCQKYTVFSCKITYFYVSCKFAFSVINFFYHIYCIKKL